MRSQRSLGGGRVDLTDEFVREVERASEVMRTSPTRRLPKKVILENLPVDLSYHSGVSYDGDLLQVSAQLPHRRIKQALRREAFYHLMPAELDSVPETMDLAWAYSRADLDWWASCTVIRSGGPLPTYDAPKIFSSLGAGLVESVVRSVLKALRLRTQLGEPINFHSYYELLTAASGIMDPPKLTRSEWLVLEALSKNPYFSRAEMMRETGLSASSISRAIGRLMELRIVEGPQQVNYAKLGLKALLLEVPSARHRLISYLLEEFPFTYSAFTPIDPSAPVYFVVLFPSSEIPLLRKALEGSALVSVIKRQTLKVGPKATDLRSALASMSEAYDSAPGLSKRFGESELEARVRLKEPDIRLLNLIAERMRVSISAARRAGIKSAEYRLRRLREEGVIMEYYLVGGCGLGEPIAVKISGGERDYERLSAALSSVGSVAATYVEGDFTGIWAIVFAAPESALAVARAIRLAFGNMVKGLSVSTSAPASSWRLPVELWDEGRQKFRVGTLIEEIRRAASLPS